MLKSIAKTGIELRVQGLFLWILAFYLKMQGKTWSILEAITEVKHALTMAGCFYKNYETTTH